MHYFFLLVATIVVALGLPFAAYADDDEDFKLGVAHARYDRTTNETTIEVQRLEVGSTSNQLFILNAAVVFRGKRLVQRPDEVIFIIQIGSYGYRYADNPSVKLSVDGIRQPDLRMYLLGRGSENDVFVETIGGRIPYETFKSMAMANNVELEVERTTIRARAPHLAILADMDRMIDP